MELSEPTDRLTAIAAIAQRFARHNPDDEYICGLWKSCILQGLLFRHHGNKNITGPHIDYGPSTVVNYTAPSWSWASVQGKVYGSLWLTLSPLAELTSVNLRYLDNDQFGRVAPGSSITLRAPVLDCVWDVEYEPDETLSFWQDISIPRPEGSTISWRSPKEYDTYGELRQRETVKVCVLLMGLYEDGGWEALILRRISDSGHHFRVGILCEFERSDAPFSGLKEVLEGARVRKCVIE